MLLERVELAVASKYPETVNPEPEMDWKHLVP
jgi:hypothetical protein